MDVTLSYDAENDIYLVFLGSNMMIATKSYVAAIERFNHYCNQFEKIEDYEHA
jgi:hypothetical protein